MQKTNRHLIAPHYSASWFTLLLYMSVNNTQCKKFICPTLHSYMSVYPIMYSTSTSFLFLFISVNKGLLLSPTWLITYACNAWRKWWILWRWRHSWWNCGDLESRPSLSSRPGKEGGCNCGGGGDGGRLGVECMIVRQVIILCSLLSSLYSGKLNLFHSKHCN